MKRKLFLVVVILVVAFGLMALNGGNGSSMLTMSTGEELITIAVGDVTSVQNFFPANSVNRGLSCRVVTAITGTNVQHIYFSNSVTTNRLGNSDFPSSTGFGVTTFTAGTTFNFTYDGGGFGSAVSPDLISSTPAKLIISTDASSITGGTIRCTAYYDQFVAPTS